MTAVFTDKQVIESFKQGGEARNRAWEFVYKTWGQRIIGTIIKRGGTREEAKDAIQEAHGPFERRICKPDFDLQYQLSTYFTGCVLNQWARSKKGRKADFVELDNQHIADFVNSVEADIASRDLAKILDETLSRLGERCHQILRHFMEGLSMKEIAEKMGFSGGEQVAKNEKGKCQGRYEVFLQENPSIKQHILNLRHG